jgi:hypothetical protein
VALVATATIINNATANSKEIPWQRNEIDHSSGLVGNKLAVILNIAQ